MRTIIQSKYFFLLLIFVLGMTHTLQAQDPCEEAGYILSSQVNDADCYGTATGNATIASTGCDCMFSGCKYLWSNGDTLHTAENLPAGIHTVTLLHPDGCEMYYEVTVGQPDAFIGEYTINHPSCAGASDGSITINPAPLSGQLVHFWSTNDVGASLTGLGAGMYVAHSVNFMDCEIVDTIYLEDPSGMEVDIQVQETCVGENNGSLAINIEGGSSPYEIAVFNSAGIEMSDLDALASGTYTILVEDGNTCSFSTESTVEAEDFEVFASSDKTEICWGWECELTASGGLSYEWEPKTGLDNAFIANPKAAPESTTSYVVTITNENGCTKTAEVEIIVDENTEPQITIGNSTICNGESTNLFALLPGGFASYEWQPTIGISNPNTNAVIASPTQTTTYKVIATDSEGCKSDSEVTIEVESCNSTSVESISETLISVYPNPSSGLFYVGLGDLDSPELSISLFNVIGKQLAQFDLDQSTTVHEIDLSQHNSGIYFLQISNGLDSFTKKLIKR